jgi:hypothetical protein
VENSGVVPKMMRKVLLEELIVTELVKKVPTFYGT